MVFQWGRVLLEVASREAFRFDPLKLVVSYLHVFITFEVNLNTLSIPHSLLPANAPAQRLRVRSKPPPEIPLSDLTRPARIVRLTYVLREHTFAMPLHEEDP